MAERGGIGRKDLHAFEELHARARRHCRAATMRLVHRIKKEAEQQRLKPEIRQGAQPIQDGVVEAAATIPAEGIQPAGPDDRRLHTPAQAAPPIETVAMPIERDLAGDPPAVAPPVKKPPIPTKEEVAADSLRDAERYREARDRYITSDADILGGTPVIAGTRLTVYAVLGRLQDGDVADDLAEDYPEVSREAFEAAELYAKAHPPEDAHRAGPGYTRPEGSFRKYGAAVSR